MIRIFQLYLWIILSAVPVVAQGQQLSPNCLNYAVSRTYDYQIEPLWLNRSLDTNEARFLLSEAEVTILNQFSEALSTRGKQLFFLPFPDSAQFKPGDQSAQQEKMLMRFEALYHDLTARLEDAGITPIDMMWLARQNRLGGDLHRNLDHHLTSRGRYVLAAQIARSIQGRSTRDRFDALSAQYDLLPREVFEVWQPSARNFVIDACIEQIDRMESDEFVELPSTEILTLDGLFGDSVAENRIALLGTSQSLSAQGNLADFIANFSDREVVNYSEAGGGASTAMQFAAQDGVFDDPTYSAIIWEVASDYDAPRLVGAALTALGYLQETCAQPANFTAKTTVAARYSEWARLDLPAETRVLQIDNLAMTKGTLKLRFTFDDRAPVEAEVWRWSQTQDPASLGAWRMFIPEFEIQPTEIAILKEGLYADERKGALSLTYSTCS